MFLEAKTGLSALNQRERQVWDAIEAGLVQWVEIRPDAGRTEAHAPEPGHVEVGVDPFPDLEQTVNALLNAVAKKLQR